MSFQPKNSAYIGESQPAVSSLTSHQNRPLAQPPVRSIKKGVLRTGEIEYKMASSRQEVEGAMALVYSEYISKGLILPENYKSPLRVTFHHLLPETVTFVGLHGTEVVATCTVITDSALGLPMDTGYYQEIQKFRKEGRKVCEVGNLAIKSNLFNEKNSSGSNFNKLDLILTLFKFMFQYTLFYAGMDDMCIVVNPKLMLFKILPPKPIGEIKHYGFDDPEVNKKAALAKRLDLRYARQSFELCGHALNMSKVMNGILLGDLVPLEVYEDRYRMTNDDVHYFFVEKSDVWGSLTKMEKDYIVACRA